MSTPDSIEINKSDFFSKYNFPLILFLLLFAVIFRAGNRPLPLMVLELVAIALLILCFFFPAKEAFMGKGLKVSIWALVLLPLVYLVPIPWELWTTLPGRELYADTLNLLSTDQGLRATSIYPLKTQLAWLALLPPVAIFLCTLRLPVNKIKILVYTMLAISLIQASLGLIQYGEGVGSFFRFGNPYASNGAEGTYANRNHLAGLLEMFLPIALGMLALSVGQTKTELHQHRSWRMRLVTLSGWQMNKTVVFGFICLMMMTGLVFTQSRSGVALAMLGIFISAIAYSRRLGGTNVFGVVGSFIAVTFAIAIEIGLAPLLQRFSVDHLGDLRFVIFDNTIKGIGTFFPIGSGPGTYPFIYPRFQSIEERGFINHAHNDYLEWLMEGGLLAAAIILILLFLYLQRWPKVWVKGYWSTFQFMQVGAGIGILLMLLHGLTDFNLHIPANALYFSFLAAIFFYPYKNDETVVKHHKTKQPDKQSVHKVKTDYTGHVPVSTLGNDETSGMNVDADQEKNEDIPNPFTVDDDHKD